MKQLLALVSAIIITAALTLTSGCKKEGAAADVNTDQVSSSFASAEAPVKSQLDEAVSAVKAGDYATGLTKLQALAANVKLTPEQQQALKDFIAQVQAKVTSGVQDAAKTATDSANKALEGLPKPAAK